MSLSSFKNGCVQRMFGQKNSVCFIKVLYQKF